MSKKSKWQDKIGVGEKQHLFGRHVGTSKDIPAYREDNGKIGGKHTEHWDGRVDATIIAPTLVKNASTGEVSSIS